ncbi:hypothetical protein C8R44DRAFT_644756 [Mycena epipterygia]|nr:hypothetical protein C8R44DRAFT_644756 [Mycena epipterygia]
MELRTFPITLEPGFREPELTWQGGGVPTRNAFLQNAGNLLGRPHAGAFLMKGGIINRIALWINPDLPLKLAQGPSTRVTEYYRGFVLRGRVASEIGIAGEVSLTRDQVSDEEVRALLGYINKGGPEDDTSLFPPQWMLEQELPGHFNGAIGESAPRCYTILENLKAEIFSGHTKWRNRRAWISYFHSRNIGRFAPAPGTTPTLKDFHQVQDVIKKVYPINWDQKKIWNIKVPEDFDLINP